MAIYPVHSNYVIDVDIITTTSFKAGMVLMRDDNGRAIPADNASLLYRTIQQKSGKILGYAASDHDAFGNTIIVPDVIGSSYLDENRNFVRFENNEVKLVKRALPDLQDPNYNISNPTDRSVVPKRGIAVYNQPDEIYITDQFVRVLHGDFGQDFTDTIDFNPGDLLTVGSGVNAGKLVKVNINSLGTDIIVLGVVEKFVSATGLLHFSNVFYSLTFSGSSAVMVLDAGNSFSFSDPASLLANDLSLSNNDGTLTNGVSFSSNNGGTWVFDGANDYISIPKSGLLYGTGPKTLMAWARMTVNTGSWQIIMGYGNPGGSSAFFIGVNGLTTAGGGFADDIISGTISLNTWFHLTLTYNSNVATLYLNGLSTISSAKTWNVAINIYDGAIGRQMNPQQYWNGNITDVRLYNRALSASEISAYYNATKSRYGL